MDPLAQELAAHVRSLMAQVGTGEGGRLLVALSGGPDSLCLAHLLWSLRDMLHLKVVAAHLDHGIRPTSAEESDRVARLCRGWGMTCVTQRADVPALARRWRLSLEMAARRARYAFLAEVARQHDCPAIAVAHHADDQVETVLLRLLRGAGAGGLRGMRSVAPLDPTFDLAALEGAQRLQLLRPLLGVTREQVEAYCRRHDLSPIRDDSNADESTPRNWLRHAVVPVMRERMPHLAASVGRAADILAAEDDLIQKMAVQAWRRCASQTGDGWVSLQLDALAAEHPALRRRVIRKAYGWTSGSLRDLGWRHVCAIEKLIASSQVGNVVVLPGGILAEIGYGTLNVGRRGRLGDDEWRPRLASSEPVRVAWPGVARPLKCDWALHMRVLPVCELSVGWNRLPDDFVAHLDADLLPLELTLRTRRPGDRLRPLGMGGAQSLQDLFVDRRVPRRERDQVPLLLADDVILWVVGCRLAADAAITERTARVLQLRVVPDHD